MKPILYILLLSQLLILSACSKEEAKDAKQQTENAVKEVQKEAVKEVDKKLEAKTITLKEVSRIALVEAKQFLSLLSEKAPDFDSTKANELYAKADALFNKGEFKEAQKLAVEVRHVAEEILIEAKKKLEK